MEKNTWKTLKKEKYEMLVNDLCLNENDAKEIIMHMEMVAMEFNKEAYARGRRDVLDPLYAYRDFIVKKQKATRNLISSAHHNSKARAFDHVIKLIEAAQEEDSLSSEG